MKEYLISLLAAAPVLAIIGILSPEGIRSGLSKHIRLVSALVWICILIAPIYTLIGGWKEWQNGDFSFDIEQGAQNDYQSVLEDALNSQSSAYFCDMLTKTLEEHFSIAKGDVRCHVEWLEEDGDLRPKKITLFLSGSAVWKSPRELEAYVTDLLGCACITVIE